MFPELGPDPGCLHLWEDHPLPFRGLVERRINENKPASPFAPWLCEKHNRCEAKVFVAEAMTEL
jgi:hypothetical protein